MVETRVGGIENAEPVLAWLDLEKRHDLAIDAIEIAERFLDPERMFLRAVDDGGVVEGAVTMEEAILQHERNLVLAAGKIQCPFSFIANEIKACQACVDIETGDAEAMIVIPESSRGLAVWVGRRPGIEFWAMLTLCREPCFGVAIVVGQDAGSVEVGNVADIRNRGLGPVNGVIDRAEGVWWASLLTQLILRGCPLSASIVGPGQVPL